MPPAVDLGNEQRLAALLSDSRGVVAAAHDVSEGGLNQTLVELAINAGCGVVVDLAEVADDAFTALFSESASRVVVAMDADNVGGFFAAAEQHGVPATLIGELRGDSYDVASVSIPMDELESAWKNTLPELFGHAAGANSVV